MTLSRKRGKLSKADLKFITDHMAIWPIEQIARELNRSVDCVKEYAGRLALPPGLSGEFPEPGGVKSREAWKRLSWEFTADELRYFGEQYALFMSQFKGDVLPTEEKQIWQAITIDIMMSRNLQERKEAMRDRDTLQAKLLKTPEPKTADDKRTHFFLQAELAAARDRINSGTSDFAKLQSEYNRLTEAFKGARSQRIQKGESEKQNFIGILKMLADRERAELEGKLLGLAQLAEEKEYKRLGELHTYVDGGVDRPILSIDTLE